MSGAKHDLSIMMTEFEKACRKADLKVTHQRLEVYRELAQSYDHPSAERLYKCISKRLPTISLDTVYRTLATFEKNHLIRKVQTVESQARFDANMVEHHHAICTHCGAITDFTWNLFEESQFPAEIAHWGEVVKRNIVLEGVCRDCAS